MIWHYFIQSSSRDIQTVKQYPIHMRRREPLEVEPNWKHPLPMPMPYQPVCVTQFEAVEQIAKLASNPRVFMWTDSERIVSMTGSFWPVLGKGVPPQGIEAELNAWMEQYPDAWLAVDLRDGVMPPSTTVPVEQYLATLPRQVLVIVSGDSNSEVWPSWSLPV